MGLFNKKPIRPRQALWDGGKEVVTFEFHVYKVLEHETPTWWCNQVVGEYRQGIEITHKNGTKTFLDNKHGDGYRKLIVLGGSSVANCKTVINYEILIRDIDDPDWNIIHDTAALDSEKRSHDDWIEQNFPEFFREAKQFRESFEVTTKNTSN